MRHSTLESLYDDIGKAIRQKLGSGTYAVYDFPFALDLVPDGSDATATPQDINQGYTALVNRQIITGNASVYNGSFRIEEE